MKVGILLFAFLLIVAAGLQTAQSSMNHMHEKAVIAHAEQSNEALHQWSITCQRFFQQAARTMLLGVQSLLD